MQFYGTEEGFSDYVAGRGVTPASGDVSSALLRASMSLDAVYNQRWVGTPIWGQDRAWPRNGAVWPDGTAVSGVPSAVEYATYELALLELAKPGSTSVVVTPGKVKTRARVEGAVDVSYAAGQTGFGVVADQSPVSSVVEGLLYGLVSSISGIPGVLVV
jgi:hypothetical protein